MKKDIQTLSKDQLVFWLAEHDIAAYRAEQILKWIFHRQTDDFSVMTDLSQKDRDLLHRHFHVARLERLQVAVSEDGTRKYLFRLSDGNRIESVLIPERGHFTACVSTQVGCAQGCRFCLTARRGFVRNLHANEIVSQIRDIKNDIPDTHPLTNIVFMGMGEPLANYHNVLESLQTLTDGKWGFQFAGRKVTVSTAGLIPELSSFGFRTKVNLAVSLNATENQTRTKLMPINRRYPLEKLLEACRKYPLMPHRRITFEYILINGINDSPADAHRLAAMLKPLRAKINLIPFNEFEGCDFKQPDKAIISDFQESLIKLHCTAIVRKSKGGDIAAACGQLSGRRHGNRR